jgi:hypothetical protein
MNDVSIDYELMGAGWAKIVLRIADAHVEFANVSNLGDPLRDFIIAAIEATESNGATIDLYDEPGAWRIALRFDECSPWETEIDITVTEHPELLSADKSKGTLLYQGACDADSFAKAVLAMADKILTEIGAETYANEWDFRSPFPFRSYAGLKAAIAVPRPIRDPRDG